MREPEMPRRWFQLPRELSRRRRIGRRRTRRDERPQEARGAAAGASLILDLRCPLERRAAAERGAHCIWNLHRDQKKITGAGGTARRGSLGRARRFHGNREIVGARSLGDHVRRISRYAAEVWAGFEWARRVSRDPARSATEPKLEASDGVSELLGLGSGPKSE